MSPQAWPGFPTSHPTPSCTRRTEPATDTPPRRLLRPRRKVGQRARPRGHTGGRGGRGGAGPHRVFCLGDPDDEDQLGEEERRDEVLVDAVQVGAERLHQRQEHEGRQQGGQRQGHSGVGDDLQGQDLSVLRAGWLEAGEHVRATARMEFCTTKTH